MEQQTGSKLGKGYGKAERCHPPYLTSMRSTLCGLDEAQAGIKVARRNIHSLNMQMISL